MGSITTPLDGETKYIGELITITYNSGALAFGSGAGEIASLQYTLNGVPKATKNMQQAPAPATHSYSMALPINVGPAAIQVHARNINGLVLETVAITLNLIAIPSATCAGSTNQAMDGLTFNGTIAGIPVGGSARFRYGTANGGPYATNAPALPYAVGAVSAALTGLAAGTVYYYVLEVLDAAGVAVAVSPQCSGQTLLDASQAGPACPVPPFVDECPPKQVYSVGGVEYISYQFCDKATNTPILAVYQLCDGEPSGAPTYYDLLGQPYIPVGTVGLCDTGIDYETLCDKGTDPNTRILALWDTSTVPPTLDYFTPAADGTLTPYVPVGPVGACPETDTEESQLCHIAMTAGDGYAVGDQLLQILFWDTGENPPTLTATVWRNQTQNTTLATAPLQADLTSCGTSTVTAEIGCITTVVNPAPFAPAFPGAAAQWQRSIDFGVTWASNPAPSIAHTTDVTDKERYRTTVTIPADVVGTLRVGFSGDNYDGIPNDPGSMYWDGILVSGDTGLGVLTYVEVPAVPGPHTLEWRHGVLSDGVTALEVSYDYTEIRLPDTHTPVEIIKRFDAQGNLLETTVLSADGVTTYDLPLPAGQTLTTGPCPADSLQMQMLCDDSGTFIRRYRTRSDGQETFADFALDGVTVHAVTGSVTECVQDACMPPQEFCYSETVTNMVPGRRYTLDLTIAQGFAVESLLVDLVEYPSNVVWEVTDADGTAFAAELQAVIQSQFSRHGATVTVTAPPIDSTCGEPETFAIEIECANLAKIPPSLVQLKYNAGRNLIRNPAYLEDPLADTTGTCPAGDGVGQGGWRAMRRSDAGGTLLCTDVANRGWESNDAGTGDGPRFEVWCDQGVTLGYNVTPTPRGTPVQEINAYGASNNPGDGIQNGQPDTIWQTFVANASGSFNIEAVVGGRTGVEQFRIRLSTGDTNDVGVGDLINDTIDALQVTAQANAWTRYTKTVNLVANQTYTLSLRGPATATPASGGLFTDLRAYQNVPGERVNFVNDDDTCTVEVTDTITRCELWQASCSAGLITEWRKVDTGLVLTNAQFWAQSPAPGCCTSLSASSGEATLGNLPYSDLVCGTVGGEKRTLIRQIITDQSGGVIDTRFIDTDGAPVNPTTWQPGSCASSAASGDAEVIMLCDDIGSFLRHYGCDGTTTDTALDGTTAYTVTGTVKRCDIKGATPIILCDDNGSFLRHLVYADNGLSATIYDTAFDGTTAYTATGTVKRCDFAVAYQLLCDYSAGTVVPFLRRFAQAETGALVVTDTALDAVTAYTVAGTVGDCALANVDPVILCDDNGSFLRHVLYSGDGTTVTVFDTDMDGVDYTTVGTVKNCGASGRALIQACDKTTETTGNVPGACGTNQQTVDAVDIQDAEEKDVASGLEVNVNDNDLEMAGTAEAGESDHQIAVRFTMNVPQGATICNAYIQFTSRSTTSFGTLIATIRGEAADTSAPFTTTAGMLTARAKTTANVSWNVPLWPTSGQAGAAQRTPDLSTIVQEIVDRAGWVAGNNTAFIFTPGATGYRRAQSLHSGTAVAPKLHVEYVLDTPGGSTDVWVPFYKEIDLSTGLATGNNYRLNAGTWSAYTPTGTVTDSCTVQRSSTIQRQVGAGTVTVASGARSLSIVVLSGQPTVSIGAGAAVALATGISLNWGASSDKEVLTDAFSFTCAAGDDLIVTTIR